jgi:hypothetical protein
LGGSFLTAIGLHPAAGTNEKETGIYASYQKE